EYEMFLKAKAELKGSFGKDEDFSAVDIGALKDLHTKLLESDSILKKALAKDTFTGRELDQYVTKSFAERRAKNDFLSIMKTNNMLDQTNNEFIEGLKEYIEYI